MNLPIKKHFNTQNILIVLGFVILLETISLLSGNSASGKTLEQYASDVVETCAHDNYRPACYDKEIPKLMDYISMEDAFKVTSLVQDLDSSYIYCHVLGHQLSSREVKKDPSKWKEVVTRVPSGLCSNGGIHGAFQERFRAESLSDDQILAIKPDLLDICEARGTWMPTGLEQASCYHALGHLTMYITSAELDRALPLCDVLALKSDGRDFRHLCYDGVFMQIYQPLEPEDFALIEGKEVTKDGHASFCSKFSGEIKASCWSEGWPLYHDDLQKPEGLTAFCEKTEAAENSRCYEGGIYIMAVQLDFDKNKIIPYCQGLDAKWQSGCVASAASRFIETDYRNIEKAVALCEAAVSFDKNGECFSRLVTYSRYNYHPGSSEASKVCEALPGSWKESCLKQR